MREFALEASSSAMSMTVGTLVEDRKGGGDGEEDLERRRQNRRERRKIRRGPESTNAANAAGVERETKK